MSIVGQVKNIYNWYSMIWKTITVKDRHNCNPGGVTENQALTISFVGAFWFVYYQLAYE